MKKKTGLDRLRDLVGQRGRKEEKEVMLIEPDFGRTNASLFYKGTRLSQQGNYEEAIACFDQVLKSDPKSSNTWCNKGTALMQLRKLNEANDCFDRSLQIDPKNAMTWHNKGIIFLRSKKMDDALKSFENAIKYSTPDDGLDIQKEQKLVDDIKSGNALFM